VLPRTASPPHVVIDYTPAIHQGAGIGHYTRGLIGAALKQDPDRRYSLLYARARSSTARSRSAVATLLPPNARPIEIPLSPRWCALLWYRWRLPMPLQSLVGHWDIYHSPDFVLPRLSRGRSIVTVHDLSFLRTPQFAEPSLRRYLQNAVPKAVRQADRVLADSAATQADLQQLLHVPALKIQVVHAACDERFRRVEDEVARQDVRRSMDLPTSYILSVGTLEPRKNFDGLVRAYHLLLQARPDLPHHLVIVGRPGWLDQGIQRAIAETGLAGRVHLLSSVPDEDLPAIYTLAELFVFPSWYEGFGLPPLEAMACGVPVISSDRGSLGEVLGSAAAYVPPDDVAAIARAMAHLLERRDEREQLALAGPHQAAHFSWAQSAERLLEVYQSLTRPTSGRGGEDNG
jgi:glycosyltransferase involved in cell wall biosynthesis